MDSHGERYNDGYWTEDWTGTALDVLKMDNISADDRLLIVLSPESNLSNYTFLPIIGRCTPDHPIVPAFQERYVAQVIGIETDEHSRISCARLRTIEERCLVLIPRGTKVKIDDWVVVEVPWAAAAFIREVIGKDELHK